MGHSSRHPGLLVRLAFWRGTPGPARPAGTLPALAILGLVLPLLLAVATQYTTQIVPDFDDYDWDGPDDDLFGEDKSHAVGTAGDSHTVGTQSLASPGGNLASLPGRTSFQRQWDSHHPEVTSLPHPVPDLFRGPPTLS